VDQDDDEVGRLEQRRKALADLFSAQIDIAKGHVEDESSEEEESEEEDDDKEEKEEEEKTKKGPTRSKKGGKVPQKSGSKGKDLDQDKGEGLKDTDTKPMTDLDLDYDSEDSENERTLTTFGNIPIEWYDDYNHLGYDLDGNPVEKPRQEDHIDRLIARNENADSW